ncbi:hypothetical protein [Mesobacillus foraminis]|uniref:Uncharacterized protein n=1 Tax=Mesobacillus foraminis TaxID=279826 RepID=A0A4R2BLK6_9BACI|nr:hypothetical protein [Mesobacillus foraminis]MBT2755208.1 hypothetical protein [Mesobacillus foraminis]TCN27129.1 hypothetical protein EV146_10270 [Mesobacillus foraminis]
MRLVVLSILTVLLGVLIYINFSSPNSKEVFNDQEKEYSTREYVITRIDEDGYYGKSEDGQKIYFKKEKVESGQNLKVNDPIIVYFEKDGRVDGLVKVEEKSRE